MERLIEHSLFASRWLMAPMYLGLIGALVALLMNFVLELWHLFANFMSSDSDSIVLAALALIDITLAGNLVLIVMFAGYENFVSRMNIDSHEDHPSWKKSVDFSTLKLKLIASIVAISAIHLLEIFMDITKFSEAQIKWSIIIHVVFVTTGVLVALTDRVATSAKLLKG